MGPPTAKKQRRLPHRKAPLEREGQGIAGMALMCDCYWTVNVNCVVAVVLPEVALTLIV
jgi:hypothetical protein